MKILRVRVKCRARVVTRSRARARVLPSVIKQGCCAHNAGHGLPTGRDYPFLCFSSRFDISLIEYDD